MNPNEINLNIVNRYLQLETIAFTIAIITSFINVIFVVIGKSYNIYIMLIINCFLLVISDFILIPNFGVNGVAYSNILVNIIMAFSGILLLIIEKQIKFSKYDKTIFKKLKEWCKVGLFSGGQQFIDNFIYAVMIVKMVNMVAEQGNYWNANNFIWGWLLIPITALAEVIKNDCQKDYQDLKQSNYFMIISFVVFLWIISIPLWKIYYQYLNKLENYQEIFLITLKLFPFYIAYALCIIPDNIFIGYGKTIYNLFNSLFCNIVYYGIFFILYLTNKITFTMNTIILMFGFGMVVHLIISLIEEKLFLKNID